ncbi:hypothetical protein CC80DRAFT_179363 [Byssothecium circinans]|uniref:Uncharacterized protein n=1 Tax=Byssothecium circinans TaxID=147558 RepID=A0A6A5THM4_9PLEO|nr:hypothetical protein CC80DRAFT_179363 [Byssothecium circinans]
MNASQRPNNCSSRRHAAPAATRQSPVASICSSRARLHCTCCKDLESLIRHQVWTSYLCRDLPMWSIALLALCAPLTSWSPSNSIRSNSTALFT